MRIATRERWISQPPFIPQLDRTNPLTQRLLRCVWFGNGNAIDLVTGLPLTKVGTSINGGITAKGRGQTNGNETSYWTLPVLTELPNLGSFGWLGSQNGGTSTIIMRDATGSSGTIPFWRNSGFDMRLGGTDYSAAGTFNASTVYAVLVSASASAAKLYVDGTLVISGGTPGATGLTSPWYLHQNGTGAQGGLSTSILLLIWDRAVTENEAISWTRNPWQIFRPVGRPLVLGAVSSGAYTLPCGAGSYALTGSDALADYVSVADAGSYGITGQDAGLSATRVLAAGTGSFSVSGQDISALCARLLALGQGTYSIGGQDAALLGGRLLNSGQGAYSISGQDAALTYTQPGAFVLPAGVGSYTLSGQAAALTATRLLQAAQGAYAVTGQDATLTYTPNGANTTLTADAGAYSLTGSDIAFARTYSMSAGYGSYTLTGRPVTLTYSGAAVPAVRAGISAYRRSHMATGSGRPRQ